MQFCRGEHRYEKGGLREHSHPEPHWLWDSKQFLCSVLQRLHEGAREDRRSQRDNEGEGALKPECTTAHERICWVLSL